MKRDLNELLGELNRQLLQEHRSDKALFEELTEIQRRSGIMHGSRPISPFLRPYFLAGSKYAAIRHTARVLSSAFNILTHEALHDPYLMGMLGLTDREERFARFETGYDSVSVTSRLDTFLSQDGFKFLEYNAETPAGVGDQAKLEALYTRVPAVREFLSENPHFYPQPQIKLLEALDRAYHEYGGSKAFPNIAIVDWEGVDTSPEFEILRDFFESRDHKTIICDPDELEYDGEVLRRGDFEVDVFYKRVIIHEFLARYDESHPIARAIAAGAVCMANSFRSKIPHKKSSFAILSDDRFHRYFTSDQLVAIRNHIPWTRKVQDVETTYKDDAIELLELLRNERFRFVLKPNDDYGGKGIKFGWESTESEWDDAIEHALEADYVVQERADVERINIPVFANGEARIESLTVDFDPFLFMGEVEGGMVRLASGSLVNITQGGGETALAILEEF